MNFAGTVRLNPLGVCFLVGTCVLLFLYMNYRSNGDFRREISSNNLISLKEMLIKAIDAAVKGGIEVRKVKNGQSLHEMSKGKTKEGANDPVTDADFMSHCVMYQTLTQAFPKVKVISEEKPHEQCKDLPPVDGDISDIGSYNIINDVNVNAEDITVWIDPLDATQEFIESLLQYVTTMVCIAVKGIPTIGVIHQPFEGPKTTWAWVGHEKTSDLLHIGQAQGEKQILVSRSHAGEVKNITKIAFGNEFVAIPAGGAGYKVLEVVHGNASAYVHVTAIKKWDICAGDAVLRSVGGRMTTIAGDEIDYSANLPTINTGGLLATAQKHDWFGERLKEIYINTDLTKH